MKKLLTLAFLLSSISGMALMLSPYAWSFTPAEIEQDAKARTDNYGSGYSDMGTARRDPDRARGDGRGRSTHTSGTNLPQLGDRDGNSKNDTINTKASGLIKESTKIPMKNKQ